MVLILIFALAFSLFLAGQSGWFLWMGCLAFALFGELGLRRFPLWVFFRTLSPESARAVLAADTEGELPPDLRAKLERMGSFL